MALTPEFTEDRQKLIQWRAFIRKGKLDAAGTELSTIAERLRAFLMPPTDALVAGADFEMGWPPDGPWQARTGP